MSRLYNEFDFIGELAIPRDNNKFHEIKDNGKGWEGHRLSFGVQESKLNSVFVELYGGQRTQGKSVVYSFSKGTKEKKGSSIEVNWADRLKPETLDLIADFSKITIDLETDFDKKSKYIDIGYRIRNLEYEGTETDEDKKLLAEYKKEFNELATNRYEFISEYDAILFLSEKLKENSSSKFRIKGSVTLNEWKGKYYKKYVPSTIEIVPEEYTNQLKATLNVFFNKSSLDETALKEEGKIYVDGYLQDYVKETKADGFFPQMFVINATKLDFDNEKHIQLLNFLKGQFSVKGRNYYHLQWETNIYRGAEKVDIKYEDLTAEQKMAIDVGLAKLEDYAPKGGAFGNNIEEMRLVKPLLKGVFSEGAADTDMTEDELLSLVVQSSADVKLEDVVKKEDSPTKDVVEDKVDDRTVMDTMDSLFG